MTIAEDVFAPRTEEERFRIYVRAGRELTLLATAPDAASVGVAIFTLDEDEIAAGTRGLIDRGIVGVLDAITGRWILHPWPRPG